MIVFVVLLALLGLILYRIAHNPIFMMIVIIVALHWALAERVRAADVEISATPKLIEAAKRLPTCYPTPQRICINLPNEGNMPPVYHFRRNGNVVQVCADHHGNDAFCVRTSLETVRKIDERAEDACQHGAEGISHAMTGPAIVLNYQCKGGHMVREPYAYYFNFDGYKWSEWLYLLQAPYNSTPQ